MLFTVCPAYCNTYYVATNGSDSNSGTTIDDPFLTIPHAVGLVVGGDTIYVRGGTYTYSGPSIAITLNAKSGASDVNRCYLMGYNDERPLLDCSAMTGTGADCIKITGNYWYIKGLDIKGASRNGINLNGGSNTIVEFCSTYENRSAGVQIQNGSAYNQIINCDSYYNYDVCSSPPGKNADGFSPKTDVGTDNYFYGCRSWQNSDDGYDGYLSASVDVNTTYENCWAFKNGWYWLDGSTNSSMNGNGFKMGSSAASSTHNVILKNCLSFQNKAKGFDQNHNRGDMTLYNCTAFSNGGNNYSIYETLASGKMLRLTNDVNLTGGVNLLADGNVVVQTTNSWMSPFDVNNADFVSIDANEAYGPRKADGSLPDVNFMHLAPGSDLIDGGTDVNLPYNGAAPDLGAFEYLPGPGDCHPDGLVNLLDLACLAANWTNTGCGTCNGADFNDDNKVDFSDLAILAENWLK
jgi:hypothetical protein